MLTYFMQAYRVDYGQEPDKREEEGTLKMMLQALKEVLRNSSKMQLSLE